MPKQRLCSECRTDISEKPHGTKTCTTSCRQKRARRLKSTRSRAAKASAEARENPIPHAPNGTFTNDVAHEVLKEELRPVVREAITDDVMRSLGGMLKLTGRMVELIEQDMESPDDAVRQKAYSLVARYTLGNQAIVRGDENTGGAVNVVFNVPRPGMDQPAIEGDLATRECTECHEQRTDFVGNSDRCTDCNAAFLEDVKARFGDTT